MATAADSNAYGGGAGGKFRKRPAKRPQTTPYDRPATALRNAWRNNDNNGGGGGGWLSRIVDPASKLISASAHRLFSSVFRKRLLPPPQPSPDEKVEPSENHRGDAVTEGRSSIQQRDGNEGNIQNHGSVADGVDELEQILKKKTFTRSEFDRLTVLLHSRTVDNTGIAGTGRFESTPSEPPAGQSRQHLDGAATQNGACPSEAPGAYSTPAVRSKVNDDDIASPAQLAKAYMGSRSTRSPSIAEPRSHTLRDETRALTTFQSHGPLVSAVQKPLTSAGPPPNNFVIPRSRGRSAIYSMARTPYSRVPPSALKGPGTSNNDFDEQSLSSQKVLKRRSSALENDIGVGPIRRIRQKSNLHYSKALALPSSRTSLTNRAPSEVGEASLYSSSKPKEDIGDRVMPGSSSHISSKSMEMGQRILQQLEKMTPPKEKSSEKKLSFPTGTSGMELTPAMLHGKARKSLETGNSLSYLQSGQSSVKSVNPLDAAISEVQASTPKQPDKVYDSNGKPMSVSNKVHPENTEARTAGSDVFGVSNNSDPLALKSAVEVPKKSRAFQMSAYEDYLELDDDAPSNGDALNEGRTKLESSFAQSNGNMLHDNRPSPEAAKMDKHPAFPELSSSSNLVLKKGNAVNSSTPAENGFGHTLSSGLVTDKKNGLSTPSLQPAAASSDKSDIPAPSFSFGLKTSDKASLTPLSSSAVESSTPKDVKSVSPGSGYAFGTGANDAATKSPESSNRANAAVDLFKRSDDTSSFAAPTNASGVSSLGSGFTSSSTPSPLPFSSQSPRSGISTESPFTTNNAGVSATKVTVTAETATATATATASSTNNGPAGSVAFPSFQPSHASGGSATALDSTTVAASGSDIQPTKGMAFGSSISSSFSGASFSTTPSSAVPTFNFGASTSSSTINSQSPTTTGSASATQTGLSSLAGNSGDNQLGSLGLTSAPFSSSSAFVSSSSAASVVSAPVTTSSASSSIFGANWQPNSSPVFGSALSSASSGPSFGASSASTPSVSTSSGFTFGTNSVAAPVSGSSAGAPFGAPTSTTTGGSGSESSGFSFGASSSSTITSSVAPGFSFGSSSVTPPTNGSSPSTSITASVFGFGSSTSASSSAPSSTFAFGAAPTSASASSGTLSSTFSFGASSTSSTSFSAPSSAFSFGASSTPAAASPASPFSFGAPPASSTPTPAPVFSFGSAAPAPPSTAPQPSQPTFGNGGSVFGFGSAPTPSPLGTNSDQMSMEDTMADDSMQSPATQTPSPAFGQTPTTNFGFGMAQAPAPAGANPFQFGGQPSQPAAPQNPFQATQPAALQNPFQNSGSFDGGSFSLGAGGVTDKSNRKFIKARGRNRKK